MSPPTAVATNQPGGTTTGRTALTGKHLELMVRAAHTALRECEVVISPSKVNRLVRRFAKAIGRQGMTFHEFLSDEANLSPRQRVQLVANPDLARAIAYLDPVGETAVNRVKRQRGW